MGKGLAAQIAALVVVVGAVSFGGGYMIAGGPQRQAERFLIGENIEVYVKAPGEVTYKRVILRSGMTVLDAVAYVVPIKTDLTWVETMGPAIKTLDDRWLVYKVNGADPGVGMVAYQLKGGENVELTVWG